MGWRKRRGRRSLGRRPPLDISDILAWADAFHERVGRWPIRTDGKIMGQLGLTWCAVNVALAQGLRGLPGESSLARPLNEHRGARNRKALPRLTATKILRWAKAHHERTGDWPHVTSGPIADAPGETWSGVESALSAGIRGLTGGSSLARLLTEHYGVHNRGALPSLTVKQILDWADAYHQRSGLWPAVLSGPVHEDPAESWVKIDAALRAARRGLPCSSLARLLSEHDRVGRRARRPRLHIDDIVRWARAHHARTGNWPDRSSGPIVDAPRETWCAVDMALKQGIRGLPADWSLAQLLRPLRENQP